MEGRQLLTRVTTRERHRFPYVRIDPLLLPPCSQLISSTLVSLHRKVLKDITLPDGTMIPSGTLICAASHPTHHDEGIYDAPYTFDPWRFSRVRESADESGRFQLVNTSVNYLPFGHGKLSWYVSAATVARVKRSSLTISRFQPGQILRRE